MAFEQENENPSNETVEKIDPVVDYKDVKFLSRFISERGKIIPSRVSNTPIKRQREIAKAIKRARLIALLPFVAK